MTGDRITIAPPPDAARRPAEPGPGLVSGALAAARQCIRCGAIGTHFLTCPSLRLPPGYRLMSTAGLPD
jgi:hypothetical protein